MGRNIDVSASTSMYDTAIINEYGDYEDEIQESSESVEIHEVV